MGVYSMFSIATIFPIGTLLILFVGLKKIGLMKKPFLLAIDATTIFFVFSVFLHINVIFPSFSLYYVIYGMIGIGVITTYFHWKKFSDLIFKRLFKQLWRLTFLIFFIVYVALVCYGLVTRINEYIA